MNRFFGNLLTVLESCFNIRSFRKKSLQNFKNHTLVLEERPDVEVASEGIKVSVSRERSGGVISEIFIVPQQKLLIIEMATD